MGRGAPSPPDESPGPGGAKVRFSLPRAVFGENLLADLRFGPDGNLYQLAPSPDGGVTVERCALR
jgi:hypothetical protein